MVQKVVWDNLAKDQLRKAHAFIKKDSAANAEKVRKEILSTCNQLHHHPKKYPTDKYKINNDGTYRAFTLFHYRISYVVNASEIIILRMRHTSMEPLEY